MILKLVTLVKPLQICCHSWNWHLKIHDMCILSDKSFCAFYVIMVLLLSGFCIMHMQCSGAILRMSMFVYCIQGTKILDESQDQDTTDLHKCVAYIRDFTPNLDKSNVS